MAASLDHYNISPIDNEIKYKICNKRLCSLERLSKGYAYYIFSNIFTLKQNKFGINFVKFCSVAHRCQTKFLKLNFLECFNFVNFEIVLPEFWSWGEQNISQWQSLMTSEVLKLRLMTRTRKCWGSFCKKMF